MIFGRTPLRHSGRRLRLSLAGLLGMLALNLALARTVRHRETLQIEWSSVSFTSAGATVAKDVWFTRTPPSFTSPEFSAAQQQCLRDSFNAAQGKADGQTVWRVDEEASEAFREKLAASCPDLALVSTASPEPWLPGEPRREEFSYFARISLPDGPVAPAQPPSLELILLVAEAPGGTALKVDLAAAIAAPEIAGRAELTAAQAARVRESAAFAQIFLVSPATLDGPRPLAIRPAELPRFSVPIAFGLRALAEAIELLGNDRAPNDANHARLEHRLTPGADDAFPGNYRWFPQLPAVQRALRNTDIRLTSRASQLIQISHPIGGVLQASRVLPETNEWVIRVGPFVRLPAPVARVESVRGQSRDFTLEQLREELGAKPGAFEAYQRNVVALERDLDATLQSIVTSAAGAGVRAGGYFWLPAVEGFHATAMRALERQRFTAGVTATLTDDAFRYLAIFKPASLTGKVGIAFSPEQRAGLEASIAGSGLAHPQDKLSVSATSAERALVGNLSYTLPLRQNVERRTSQQLELFGQVGRNDYFRLGSVSPLPFEDKFQRGGLEHEYRQNRGNWTTTLQTAAFWEAHDLTQPTSPIRRRDGGLILRHRQQWSASFGPNDSPNRWDISLEPSATFGPALGWDDSFQQGELLVRTKRWWGGSAEAAAPMYLAFDASGGASSSELPTPLLFRQGDTGRLFGLEPGEFSGRSFYHAQAIYGVRLAHLFRRVFAADPAAGISAAPPLLQQLLAQAIAEVGSAPADGKTLESYALALETEGLDLGGVGLRLGYGWSPQSRRTNGRFFSSLNWSF